MRDIANMHHKSRHVRSLDLTQTYLAAELEDKNAGA